jgi:hypothetical protein
VIRLASFLLVFCLAASAAQAQCRGTDKTIELKLSLAAPAKWEVSQPLPVCVRHEYKLPLRAGQHLEVKLSSPSGQKSMLTIMAPSGQKPADGESGWSGTVTETGTYTIEIGTDVTTRYRINIVLR